jgi:hypothetical protein
MRRGGHPADSCRQDRNPAPRVLLLFVRNLEPRRQGQSNRVRSSLRRRRIGRAHCPKTRSTRCVRSWMPQLGRTAPGAGPRLIQLLSCIACLRCRNTAWPRGLPATALPTSPFLLLLLGIWMEGRHLPDARILIDASAPDGHTHVTRTLSPTRQRGTVLPMSLAEEALRIEGHLLAPHVIDAAADLRFQDR